MRALLVFNPAATTTRGSVVRQVASYLSEHVELEVAPTRRRDHAAFLAAGAADAGYGVVFALGGDGTVNEVVQGLAATPARLAVLPGGSTNVFARSLGIPAAPLPAARHLVRLLDERIERRVNLGVVQDRLFTFNAGIGFDADVVARVGRNRLVKRLRQPGFLVAGAAAALGRLASGPVDIDVRTGDRPVMPDAKTVLVCNTDPYTYLGRMAARVCPKANIDADLSFLCTDTADVRRILAIVDASLRGDGPAGLPGVTVLDDVAEIHVASDAPVPLQVDGDALGLVERVTFASERAALSVVA